MSCSLSHLTSEAPAGRRWTVGLASAALFLAAAACVRADEALDQYNFAVKLFNQKRWPAAADEYRRFVERFPEHPQAPLARFYHGLSLVENGDHREARAVLREFAKNHPQSKNLPDALYRVAWCSHQLDDLAAAESEFRDFVSRFNDSPLVEWAWTYLGDSELRRDKPQAAAASFQKSIDLFPGGRMIDESRWGLGRALEALKNHDAALAQYQQLAANRDGAFAERAHFALGTVQFDAGKFAEAALACARFEELFPKSKLLPAARMNAGYAWYQVGDYRKAIEQFDRAARDAAQATTAAYWKGVSLKAVGDYRAAAAILQATFEADPQNPLAEDVRFQQAVCEHAAANHEAARTLFLEAFERWPQGKYVEDSLHFAGEAALLDARRTTDADSRADRLADAARLLDRYGRQFPGGKLRMHHELLKGRLLDTRGGTENQQAAADIYRKVAAESTIPRTQLLARYYLGDTLSSLGEHAAAVETLQPVVAEAERVGAGSEFVSSLVLAGHSAVNAKQPDRAVRLLSRYLELQPDASQAELALADRALAYAHLGDRTNANLDLKTLADRYPRSPLSAERTHEVAELVYDQGTYDWAAELFESLVRRGRDSRFYPVGLSGEAWSLYHLQKFEQAAAGFDRYVREFPDDPDRSAEAAYMRGQALEKAARLDEAAAAYLAAFEKYGPARPANAAGADQDPPHRFAYLAGLQAARVNGRRNDAAAADAAYSKLLERFPRPQNLDKLLDEWALVNLEAGRFDRSDEIFRRLVREAGTSDLADNARMSLAESDFIAGRIEPARKAFQDLIASPASDAGVRERSLFQLIEIGAETQNWKDVRETAARLRQEFPESKYAWDAAFRTAEAELSARQYATARDLLLELKALHGDSAVGQARWFPGVYVLLAEAHVQLKQYDAVKAVVDELAARHADEPALHQAHEILGRSYKNQALFNEARAAFQKVLDDPHSRGTETAAKAQLMIAETWWNQQKYDLAQREYLKVYHLHTKHPAWQAPALLQAALCDEQLGHWQNAIDAYEELIRKFPRTEPAAKAADRLRVARQRATASR
ncbi:MAG TPA: tetratricopeptide repeat protein [Planctomycetaceae bacterium]|nr:tetratricopeptide repeat protein [Planctomycetaceae bacterium]